MNIKLAMMVGVGLMLCGNAFSSEIKTIKGEVIDVSCYASAGAMGEGHKTCALACLKAGEPAGILEEKTGKVYVVVTMDHMSNPATKVMPFVAKMVEVTGSVNEKGGVSTVDIKDIKEVDAMAMPEKAMMEKGAMEKGMMEKK